MMFDCSLCFERDSDETSNVSISTFEFIAFVESPYIKASGYLIVVGVSKMNYDCLFCSKEDSGVGGKKAISTPMCNFSFSPVWGTSTGFVLKSV